MTNGSRSARYAPIAILLHWVIALAIVLQIVLPSRMEGPASPKIFAITQLHKSIGITVLLLSLARLAWRLLNPPPPEPASLALWERRLSIAVHWGFYALMIGMPLTGWLMVSASRTAIPTLLYGVVPWPNLPGISGLAPDAKHLWQVIGRTGHGLLAKGIYVLLALHVAGALKHQFLDRNTPVLSRMAPGAISGRWFEPRILLIALAFVGVVGFGEVYQPPLPHMAPPPPIAAGPETSIAAAVEPKTEPAAAPTPVSSEPVRWKVALGSTLTFATTWSGAPVQGRFDHWTADILFSPDALERSKVTVVIQVDSAKTGDEQRDTSLPASDWFDAVAHPKATFTSIRFEKAGPDRYVAHGVLSLRGVTKPVDLSFRLHIVGDKAQVNGSAAIDRMAFGVGQGEFAATDSIPAKVSVGVDLRATRQAEAAAH